VRLPLAANLRNQVADPTLVTFRHLLTHTAGLAPWRDVFVAAGPPPLPPDLPDPISPSERWQRALDAICAYPFAGHVGDQVRYSDLGLMLLGEASARLGGSGLDQTLQNLVLRPLKLPSVTYNPLQNGLSRTQIIPTEYDSLWRKRRAWGEVHDENACGLGGTAGHAGLFAQARDVAALGQAWLSRDPRLALGPTFWAEALTEQAKGQFRFGLGWMLKAEADSSAGDLYSPSSYGHTGFTGTSLWIDPERQLVTVILSNRVYGGREKPGIHAFRRALHDLVVQGVDSL
jgi:CubicO group peptidase (beta-lactamase class C family)